MTKLVTTHEELAADLRDAKASLEFLHAAVVASLPAEMARGLEDACAKVTRVAELLEGPGDE